MLGCRGGRRRYPKDLRDAGRPDDPLFDRPLVYGRIDTGVVTMRRPEVEELLGIEVEGNGEEEGGATDGR